MALLLLCSLAVVDTFQWHLSTTQIIITIMWAAINCSHCQQKRRLLPLPMLRRTLLLVGCAFSYYSAIALVRSCGHHDRHKRGSVWHEPPAALCPLATQCYPIFVLWCGNRGCARCSRGKWKTTQMRAYIGYVCDVMSRRCSIFYSALLGNARL